MELNWKPRRGDERDILEPYAYNPETGVHTSMVDDTKYAMTGYEDYAIMALENPFDIGGELLVPNIYGCPLPVSGMSDLFDESEHEIVFHAMDLDLDPLDPINHLPPPPSPSGCSDVFAPFEEWIQTLIPEGLNVEDDVDDLPCLQLTEHVEEGQMVAMTRQLTLDPSVDSGAASPAQSTSDLSEINVGGHKQKLLWGESGLLGLKEDVPSSGARGKPGLIRGMTKKLKHQLAEFVDESNKGFKRKSSFSAAPAYAPGSSAAALVTSLDSMLQAKLYSELEVMICNTANGFILQQYYDGRISQQSIDKVNVAWNAKNNHHVVEFRYDQATQRELIVTNRRNIEFTGDSSRFPICLQTNLHNWKKIAHEMSIRTFCLPDCAIRKHIYDIHKIIDMMNPSLETLHAFQDVTSEAQVKMLDKETATRRQSETRMKRGF
ncbi:uncharacterized protein N7496_007122 [Penicillium cataractarum]|uniref:Uncharacterized protein n=1 Tax=Penicillium cataractarum TaxID=2100454 RepID=A0A9W9S355_9EURO|nr:uncharacterized protein N7496_007122 [Penicillium cataractarum]KAJ5371030.1 hypothetical protein N7496_007122 [Penicillium cataractarum]